MAPCCRKSTWIIVSRSPVSWPICWLSCCKRSWVLSICCLSWLSFWVTVAAMSVMGAFLLLQDVLEYHQRALDALHGVFDVAELLERFDALRLALRVFLLHLGNTRFTVVCGHRGLLQKAGRK